MPDPQGFGNPEGLFRNNSILEELVYVLSDTKSSEDF